MVNPHTNFTDIVFEEYKGSQIIKINCAAVGEIGVGVNNKKHMKIIKIRSTIRVGKKLETVVLYKLTGIKIREKVLITKSLATRS